MGKVPGRQGEAMHGAGTRLLPGGVLGLRGSLQAAEPPRRENSPPIPTAKAHARIQSDGTLQRVDRLVICTLNTRALALVWLLLGVCPLKSLPSPRYFCSLVLMCINRL